jgi:Mg2+ and Co2+ transporter CorA
MNVLIPLEENAYAFWIIFGIMCAVAIIMLAFFRLRRWI